jgi:site-specific DNA-methyltransferase (adenine-specific)
MNTHQDLVDNLMCKFNGVQIGKATLFNCDCNELMANVPEKHFELSCVDPPYGIDAANMTMGRGSANDLGIHKKKNWDKDIPTAEYFKELFRVSKNQIVWGGNYFLDYLGNTRCCLTWDKLDYNSDFAAFELAWTSFNKNCKTFQRARSAEGDSKGKIHPTQKPIKLYEWLLTNYAKPGQRILDTHLGSMSSVIACLNHGFEIVGCELDVDYFKAGVERVRKSQKQQKLFEPMSFYQRERTDE